VVCVDTFPFTDAGDTAALPPRRLDRYACAPGTDESGPEAVYRVHALTAGFLSAAVYDESGVDVDVHILAASGADSDPDPDPARCLDRGDRHARADVEAGLTWVVVDTYVRDGTPLAGPFRVDIGFLRPSQGPCTDAPRDLPRVGDGGLPLALPATGPIVLEAHLVTADEPPPYPSTPTEELAGHYALSQSRSGLVMHRRQTWAPLEGGTFYGAGTGSPTLLPVEHEAWYVNMYWTREARPPRGTRMILREPGGGPRAVVVAAGYETGPGNLAHIGGTPEETHFYMGTTHLDPMVIGFAADQGLAVGPRHCTD
jgi:hypothetical protein